MDLLMHGQYTALSGTGWNRPGDCLKPGNEFGLVGDWWRELIVEVDFGVSTQVTKIVNHFSKAVEVCVASPSKDWIAVAKFPHGETNVHIITSLVRLKWKETPKAEDGTGKTLEFWGHVAPQAPTVCFVFHDDGGQRPELADVPFEDIAPDFQGFTYKHVGEGTLVSEKGRNYYPTLQFNNLGETTEDVRAILERAASRHSACVGYHICMNASEGRHLEGALLFEPSPLWPPPVPVLFKGVGAVVSWSGFSPSEAEGSPDMKCASVEAGKGWNGWQCYARVCPIKVLTVTSELSNASGMVNLIFTSMGGDCVNLEVKQNQTLNVKDLQSMAAQRSHVPNHQVRLVLPNAALLSDADVARILQGVP